MSLDFNPPPFQDGSRLKLPLAVMASNRPVYLLRMLLSLRTVEGLDISLVTVFIDGFFDEPASVAKLFDLNVEHHAGVGKLNTRISQVKNVHSYYHNHIISLIDRRHADRGAFKHLACLYFCPASKVELASETAVSRRQFRL